MEKTKLFGTNGVRGIFGDLLTIDFVVDLVHSFGTYFEQGHIVVGCDGRLSSNILARVVQATLNSDGCEVYDAGRIPTPCLQYSAKKGNYRGGIMITASHNPPEYNGLKPIASDGVEISRVDELQVERIYCDRDFVKSDKYGQTLSLESSQEYINDILGMVDIDKIRGRKFKIVMDFGNGVQSLVAPILCEKLGCKVIPINGSIDGTYPGRGSEPTPENLSQMSSIVRESSADFGVAYDGDGDRSMFCDNQGRVMWGDRTGTLLVQYLLSTRHPRAEVVCPINTTSVLDRIVKQLGSKVRYTKVGSVEVSREMVRRKGLIGLEENGGFMYGPFNEVRDGAMTTILMLEMLASDKRPLSDKFSALPIVHQRKLKIRYSNSMLLEQVIEKCMTHGNPIRIETLDGIKIWIDEETWIMIRPSGTEPIIRIYAESTDKELIDSKVKEYSELVNQILKENT
jgi:phosphomannomutase / phosphoglucomutase